MATSIEIKQKYWREFVHGIEQAIEKVKNGETVHYRKQFGDNFYITVTAEASVVLESSAQVDEIEILREKLKALEQELALTKEQLSKYNNQHMVEFSVRRHLALAEYKREYEMNHPSNESNSCGEDEIDAF